MKAPYIVPSTARRDWAIGIAVGVAVLALLIYALMNFSGGVAGSTLKGEIVGKRFTPLAEERVTIGKAGVSASHSDGEYQLECVAGGRSYLITVDKQTYETEKPGDFFFFAPPRADSPARKP
jgi:hypothetical protein